MSAYQSLKERLERQGSQAAAAATDLAPRIEAAATSKLDLLREKIATAPIQQSAQTTERPQSAIPSPEEIRESLKYTPRQYLEVKMDDFMQGIRTGDIEELRLFEDPELVYGERDIPLGVKARKRDLQGLQGPPEDVELPKGFWSDADNFRKHQENLVSRIEKHGEAISPFSRLGKAFKYTPEGGFSFLQETYGQENVLPVFDDAKQLQNIIVIDEGTPKLVEKDSLEAADLLDVAPDVIKFGGALAANLLAGRKFGPGGVALAEAGADVGGDVGHQMISGLLPGEDFPEQSFAESLPERAMGTAAVAGAGAGANVLAHKLNPMHRVRSAIGNQRIPQTPEELMSGGGELAMKRAQDIAPIAKQLDVPLNTLERTGAPYAATLEKVLESFPGSVDAMAHGKRVKLKKFGEALDKLSEGAAKGTRVGAEGAIALISKTYKQMRKTIKDDYFGRSKKFFDEAEASGATLPLDNFSAALQKEAKAASAPVRTGGMKAILGFAEETKKALKGTGNNVTPSQLNNMLKDFGQKARGKGKLIEGEISFSESQRLAGTLMDALRKDLDAAAGSGLKGADALKQARNLYHQGNEVLRAAENSVLSKAVKLYDAGNPDKFVKGILTGTHTKNEIARAMDAIGAVNPESVLALRGAVLDQMSRASTAGVETAVGKPQTFLNMYNKNKDQLEGLFATDPKAWKIIKGAAEIAERIVEGGIIGGSKSQPLLTSLWLLGAKATAGTAHVFSIGQTSEVMSWLARAFNNPESREILMKPPPPGMVGKTGALTAAGMKVLIPRMVAITSRDRYLFPMEEPEIGSREESARLQGQEQEDLRQATEWASVFTGGGKQ